MTREEFRRLVQARPFQPFTVVMASGEKIPIWHHEFVVVSPTGRTAVAYRRDGSFDILDLRLVTELRLRRGKGKRGAVRGS